MPVNRRRFLKYAGATAAVVGGSALGLDYLSRPQTTELNQVTATSVTGSNLETSTLLGSTSASETRYATLRVPAQGCYLGAYIGDFPGLAQVEEFENMVGKKLTILHVYNASDPFPIDQLQAYVGSGRVPMVSWKPVIWDHVKQQEVPTIGLQDIIDGKYDDYLRKFAGDAKALEYPFLLRFGWEMNGDWYRYCGPNNFGPDGSMPWNRVDNLTKYYGDPSKPDGPERYIEAWKHIHDIFRKNGADNAIWAWCPNNEEFPQQPWNTTENYYPGDEYVDWVGIDFYNHGSPEWQTFNDLFSGSEGVYLKHKNKPFMLSEFACAEAPSIGSKGAWITNAFHDIRNKYRSIRAAVWFSEDKSSLGGSERDWRIDSSSGSLAAYREAISDPYFLAQAQYEE